MIIEIPDDNSIIKWKAFGEEDWKYAEISDLISAYEERPKGEWIFDSEFTEFGNPYGTYRCSVCGGHSSDEYSFCKDCGADMRGKEETIKAEDKIIQLDGKLRPDTSSPLMNEIRYGMEEDD